MSRSLGRIRRRELLQGAAGSAFAGVTILPSKKTLATRDQKLVYWHLPTFTPEADDAVQAQFDEFRKMAGLKDHEAAFVPTPSAELMARLSAAIETGATPDLVRLHESEVQLYRAQGHLIDVTDAIQKLQGLRGGLFPSCLRPVAYEGRFWGIPFAIDPWPMHARLDVLEAHGLDYPRTWDAFVETCLKIQKPPFYGFGMDLGLTRDATVNIMQVCCCFGGCTYDPAGNVAFDEAGNVKGFAFINEMYNERKIIPQGVVGNTDVAWNNRAYQSGQVAFINNQTSVYSYLSTDDPDLMSKTGLFGVPAGPAGTFNQIQTWSLGLFKQSPYPELARGLAEYFLDPDRYSQVIAANHGRFVSVHRGLFDEPWWTERPELAEFFDIASTGVSISHEAPPSAASDELLASHVIPRALQEVLVNGVDPAAAVASAHQQIAAISERLAQQPG
ncbi:MAG TPA: extracellular solute-binding protein [Geminicoccaceae bacterium]|jgi:multiple sugar transport system substrate-binding protein|nr:extracellular solute-binding protein [Geminicoccaceae bacterium]